MAFPSGPIIVQGLQRINAHGFRVERRAPRSHDPAKDVEQSELQSRPLSGGSRSSKAAPCGPVQRRNQIAWKIICFGTG